MSRASSIHAGGRPIRWLPWIVLVVILGVFAAAIGHVTLRMRRDVQRQIVTQTGDVLHAMVMMQFTEVSTDMGEPVREPFDQVQVLLKASQLQGVLVARLFETNGTLHTAFPLDAAESGLLLGDRTQVLRSEPVTRLIEGVRRKDLFVVMPNDPLGDVRIPILEVSVPLQGEAGAEVVGIAQFVLEGETIIREFEALDLNLMTRAGSIFLAGAALIGLSFGWAVRRLQKINDQLQDRTRDLLRANEELALSARTSAIGSVAAHLIHGLKNPLSGLQQFVNAKDSDGGDVNVWAAAAASTRRMQQLVSEVVRVLREGEQGPSYELSVSEFEGLLRDRMEPLAADAGVDFQISRNADGQLNNIQANLLLLILGNLVQNAIQASARGNLVTLGIAEKNDRLEFRVIDQGHGLPDSVRANLFSPCQSTKDGGTGIGLAISRQLAAHLGAELTLESSSSRGTVFVLLFSSQKSFERSSLDNPAQKT